MQEWLLLVQVSWDIWQKEYGETSGFLGGIGEEMIRRLSNYLAKQRGITFVTHQANAWKWTPRRADVTWIYTPAICQNAGEIREELTITKIAEGQGSYDVVISKSKATNVEATVHSVVVNEAIQCITKCGVFFLASLHFFTVKTARIFVPYLNYADTASNLFQWKSLIYQYW